MKQIAFILVFLLWTAYALPSGPSNPFKILPQPQSVEMLDADGISWDELTCLLTETDTPMPVVDALLDRLPRCPGKGKAVTLLLTSSNVPESAEGYVLTVSCDGVTICSSGKAGLFYGCQTLEQLMEDSRDFGAVIPSMRIVDFPSVNFRAVHFDTKHHLDRMDYYYREIDKLSRYKINAVIWEIEDKLRYERRPEIGAPNAISMQEMQALCRYAQERNVEICPLVQGLGHAGFILKHHWELRENPTSDWEFCPSDPRTYELQFDLYRDAIEAMPYGRYLHIGGDEITAIGIDERCLQTGLTPFELQMKWLRKVCDFATANGRIPIFWDDMPLKYAGLWNLINSDASEEEVNRSWDSGKLDEAIDLFPKDCVYMRWLYEDATLPANRRIVKWYGEKGLRVMGATAASYGNSVFMPRESTMAGYIKGFSGLVAENALEGILATAWDDGSPHSETVWRGYIALGEYGWNASGRSVSEFKAAHAQREFGFREEDNMMDFLDRLERTVSFFDGALVTAGRRNPAWGVKEHTLLDLPDPDKPGEWSAIYKEKIEQAKEADAEYWKISQGIGKALLNARRNRYTLRVYEQINNLQHYPTRLILALHEVDSADGNDERKEALNRLSLVCDSFETMRQAFVSTLSETRFMEQPHGYISDMNHHNHLAAKTENSDWWFWYELPMTEKVRAWLMDVAEKGSYD